MINARKAEAAIIGAVLSKVLTEEYIAGLLDEVRAVMADTAGVDREMERLAKDQAACAQAIANLMELVKVFGARSAGAEILKQEAEQNRLTIELRQLEAKRAAAQMEVTPAALAMALDVWRGELKAAQAQGDVRALRSFLKRFVAKIDLGYNHARVWYTYPLATIEHGNDTFPRGGTWSFPSKAVALSWK